MSKQYEYFFKIIKHPMFEEGTYLKIGFDTEQDIDQVSRDLIKFEPEVEIVEITKEEYLENTEE